MDGRLPGWVHLVTGLIDCTRKFNENPISGRLHDPAMELGNVRIDDLAADRFYLPKGATFVLAYEPAVS
jgi:hypothetical protein